MKKPRLSNNPFLVLNDASSSFGDRLFVEQQSTNDSGTTTSWERSSVNTERLVHPRVFRIKTWVLLASVIAVAATFTYRSFFLQVVQGEDYVQAAEANRIRQVPIPAPRGVMYDRTGTLLVRNVPDYRLSVVPALYARLQDKSAALQHVADFFGTPQADLAEAAAHIDPYEQYPAPLVYGITREQALMFYEHSDAFPAFLVQEVPKRSYLFGEALSHVLGYTGVLTAEEYKEKQKTTPGTYLFQDSIGKTGVELTHEASLRGTNGMQHIERDATGKFLGTYAEQAPLAGHDLVLSIDIDLQQKIIAALREQMDIEHVTNAAAVALDPRNGEVLSLVNLPSYDNNIFTGKVDAATYKTLLDNKNLPLLNRAIGGLYPPGSTIKPIVGALGLQNNIATPNTVINDRGVIRVPNKYNPSIVYTFYSWNHAGLGPVDLARAIAVSSDIYFYYVGGGFEDFEGLGIDVLSSGYEQFGLGKKTGIDLPGENAGFIPTRAWKEEKKNEVWGLGDTYNVSIGQGDVLTTPLQMAVAMAAIANNGTLYKPHVVHEVKATAAEAGYVVAPEVVGKLPIDDKHLASVRAAMRTTVTDGSARRLNTLTVPVAGKTGTSQVLNKTSYIAWFDAFAPYDAPKIVLVVMVENGAGGEKTSVPVAQKVFSWWQEHRK